MITNFIVVFPSFNGVVFVRVEHTRPLEQSFLVIAIQGAPADEIRGIIDAAAADILRLSRIRAEGTCAIYHIPREVRSDDSIGRDSSLHPVLQGPEHIEGVRTSATAAMMYARRHEESGELQRILTESIGHVEEVPNRANRRGQRIGPAVPHEEFASIGFEQGQIGIGGVHEVARRNDPLRVGVEVERQGIESGTEDEGPEVSIRGTEVN